MLARIVACGAFVSVLLGFAACAAEDNDDVKDSGSGMVVLAEPPVVDTTMKQLETTAGQALPISAYQIRAEARVAVIKAERMLVAACMSRFGFPDPYSWLSEPVVDEDPLDRRYGIADAATAERWGYHLPPGYKGAPGQTTGRKRPVRSEAEILVLSGATDGRPNPTGEESYNGMAIPSGGCLGEARRRLAPHGQIDDAELVRRIDGNGQSDSDPRVVEVFAKWASCMKDKGFDRTRPVKDPKAKPLAPTPTADEIREAVADVACKKQTNLVGVWFTVESAYQDVMIEQHIEELSGIKVRNDAIVARAAAIIASGV